MEQCAELGVQLAEGQTYNIYMYLILWMNICHMTVFTPLSKIEQIKYKLKSTNITKKQC